MAPRSTRRRPTGPPGLLRALLILLRAVAVCLALSLSGVVHFAVDLWLDGEAAAQHFSDCPDDDDCPPGCPACHCLHASPVLPVPFHAPAPMILLPAIELSWVPYDGGPPPSPALPAVYRPPRA
jgi:hypothetical protein